MKRRVMASILGFIFLVVTVFAAAQTPTQSKDQKKKPAPAKVQESPSPIKSAWKKLKVEGAEISVLRLFTKGACAARETDRVREVANLELTDPQYQDFVKAPEAFVNKYDIFSCKVTGKLEHAKRTAKGAAGPPSGDPRLAVYHDPDCGGLYYP